MTQRTFLSIPGRLLGAIAIAGTLLGLSASLPGFAQDLEESPEIIDQDELYNDDTGLPEGGSPPDSGLPDAGEVLTDNVIVIDGQAYEYDPTDLENNPLLDNITPLEGINSDEDLGIGADGLDDSTTDDDGMVTYPPADSVEDLEPEDILGE